MSTPADVRSDAGSRSSRSMPRRARRAVARTRSAAATAHDARVGPQGDALDLAMHALLAAGTGGLSPVSGLLAWIDWGLHLRIASGKRLRLALEAWQMTANAMARSVAPPHHTAGRDAEDGHRDPRFADSAWSGWPFCLWRDGFLDLQRWWLDATTDMPGVDRHHEALVRFFARQWLDACSPGNFVALNPVVLQTAAASGGASFVAGARHWLEDATALTNQLCVPSFSPSAHGESAFVPGRDVAITPGEVVLRSDLFELIQYTPTTAAVAREPVLVVPSWIMKYYILDLQPHNSLIRHLVDAGFTVFAISWRNPVAADRDLGLEDYLNAGVLAALDAVHARCGEPVHATGYCLGGTLLAIAAATLARDGRAEILRSLTLLAAQTDFSEPGELGLFIDASELAALDALMWHQGYLDGAQMAAAFQLLNARDLIWSRMMSEYLLGRRLKPNDLMSWNADTTRLPYRMHIEYLTGLFLNNDLAEGRFQVGGRPVALSDIEQPAFVVGTERDHVSPWRSVYKLHLLTHDAITFVLTSGGHNAGIVCEPGHAGRSYRVARRAPDAPYLDADDFVASAERVDGSWWPCWAQWLHQRSSGDVAARPVTGGIEAAPGRYVLQP